MFSDELEQRRAAIDPERLLPAERWIGVYSELVVTKRKLLATLLELMTGSSPTAREELETGRRAHAGAADRTLRGPAQAVAGEAGGGFADGSWRLLSSMSPLAN